MTNGGSRRRVAAWLAVGGVGLRSLCPFLPFSPGGAPAGFHPIGSLGYPGSIVFAYLVVPAAILGTLVAVLVLLRRGARGRAIATGLLIAVAIVTAAQAIGDFVYGYEYLRITRESFTVDATGLYAGALTLIAAFALIILAARFAATSTDPVVSIPIPPAFPASIPIPPAP
jgi:hypothetical protein